MNKEIESNVIMSAVIKDLTTHCQGTEPAAEDLRVALNDIIARYQLHPAVVLSLLARLSAGYIHLAQKVYNQTHDDVVVEEDFQNMLVAHLTSLDMNDVANEMEKMKREELN